jgi:hypothetical protein
MIKKIFGGIDMTWKKVIIMALASAVFTALVAIIPWFKYTSFHAIAVTFEVWILFGIIIIMNSKSNKDSALKCFVFFLISQPLIYLFQVPFSWQGWNLFSYYKYWFIWTILCIPMGYIGYYMKKDKWWGYLILAPMILLLSYSYLTYLPLFMFSFPKYILICLFCIATMIIYPLFIFNNKFAKIGGTIISVILIVIITVYSLLHPPVYETQLMSNTEAHPFDDTYTVTLADKKYGSVNIVYDERLEDYMLAVKFVREGKTELILTSPDGEETKYKLDIKRDTYDLERIK